MIPIRWTTAFLDLPAPRYAAGSAFWAEVTGTSASAPRGQGGEFATLLPAAGDAYLRLQRIDDGPPGCHLDLHLDGGAGGLDLAARTAVALGAAVVAEEDGLVVLRSPGGFGFCLCGWDGEATVPPPVDVGGGAARWDQLCLDIPAAGFDVERDFWVALTGWPARTVAEPEFTRLGVPRGLPLRLLLQRREHSAPGEPVSAHPDLATADRAALVERHTAAGARVRQVFPGWTVLTDPAGGGYCLTDRAPG